LSFPDFYHWVRVAVSRNDHNARSISAVGIRRSIVVINCADMLNTVRAVLLTLRFVTAKYSRHLRCFVRSHMRHGDERGNDQCESKSA